MLYNQVLCHSLLGVIEKPHQKLSQSSWFAGQDLILEPPKYEVGMLLTHLGYLTDCLYQNTMFLVFIR
jgi:hypothetical protein